MKRLFLLVFLLLFGCSKAHVATYGWDVSTETGNKIYAYQDIDPDGEHTTIIIARVDDTSAETKLVEIMKHIKSIFNKETN